MAPTVIEFLAEWKRHQGLLDQIVEVDLANGFSLSEVAHLERDIPGISAAVSRWLDDTSSPT